ncbi:helix-turn-helix domain-containing protein [Sphingomonas albertensis]|uniref:Helix-turn-helix transcriptional regulator n=1 Tax=Sphingomonas albertensis TaxID=2762591 RepID=A0ABR7AI28_9SPHN|nr:helix-turn-helix domain-containing protein [Sphingomonas albertensis]MBC3940110.1 helix-turn-helix transcriptional regulator [Sphingomonas albertensis]
MESKVFSCGLDVALSVIGGKWKPLILFHLAHDTRRYGELKRAVGGVSDKMLIQQLKELHADGVVDRRDHQQVPPKVDYSLTPFGKTLADALVPLCVWGTEHIAKVEHLVANRTAKDAKAAA